VSSTRGKLALTLGVAAIWLVLLGVLGDHGWFYLPTMILVPILGGLQLGRQSRGWLPWIAGILLAFLLLDWIVGDQASTGDLAFFAVIGVVWALLAWGAFAVTRYVTRPRPRRAAREPST
jgi:peptidoglycan/LPS O-acetylase OafA/YrhL